MRLRPLLVLTALALVSALPVAVPGAAAALTGAPPVISEIMFNPASAEDDWEWIEIHNPDPADLDLAGWVVDDGNSVAHTEANIAAGVVPAGGSAVLYNADDVTAADFAAAWGDGIELIAVTDWSAMALNNGSGGDTIGLWETFADYDGDNETRANAVVSASYLGQDDDGSGSYYLTDLSDQASWALSTDGVVTPVGTARTSTGAGGDSGADIGSPVAQVATPSELLLTQYVEGTSFNKAIEIANLGGAPVDLDGYALELYANGSPTATTVSDLTGLGTVGANDVFVLYHASAAQAIIDVGDAQAAAVNWNGDDAVALRNPAGSLVDVIGQIGTDPGSAWSAGGVSTQNDTMCRLETITAGDPDGSDAFDPSAEWTSLGTDVFDGLGQVGCAATDVAPTLASSTPADGGSLGSGTDLVVTFSEPVTTTDPFFGLTCGGSPVAATASGGPTTYTISPDAELGAGDSCTLTLVATQIVDQDGAPDQLNGGVDEVVGFTVAAACSATPIPISDVQGSGPLSPLDGQVVTVEGIVVGDFQSGPAGVSGDLDGFFVQEETSDEDGDEATSEGVFVFDGSSPPVDVSPGQTVQVTGRVDEFTPSGFTSDLTELTAVSSVEICSTASSIDDVTRRDLLLPFASTDAPEAYENMAVRFPQDLVISEYFNFDRFNEIVLSAPLAGEDRIFQPTAVDPPGSPEAVARADHNLRSRITLDDGRSSQNPDPARHPNGAAFDLTNRFRGGDLVTDTIGVLQESFDLYRIQPTAGAGYTSTNARPAGPPAVGGSLKVASFNVLNYFVTLDDGTNDICGPLGDQECRGADSAAELDRQQAKIVAALASLDADVVGLIELENNAAADPAADGTDPVLQDLVGALNAEVGAGTYDFVDAGVIGGDAIKVGLIYQPATVTPVGGSAILDSSVDPAFIDTKNRPVLIQTFDEVASGERLTVAVNHLKSKGSPCDDVGDPTDPDGQGNCNGVRTAAATALADHLATDPTGSGDADVLIVGDLNSYDEEDPIQALLAAGYDDLEERFNGELASGYVFDGQFGYLDYALSSPSLSPQVAGAGSWAINADEPDLLDYNLDFKQPAQAAIYEPNEFRSSDHDPMVVGLDLTGGAVPSCDGREATITGTDAGELIVGTSGDDVIVAGAGSDIVLGRGGHDVICGGDGDDRVLGQAGNDVLLGESGDDAILGGIGGDTISGGIGADTILGGIGADTIDGGDGDDIVFASIGHDRVAGGEGSDLLAGGLGRDTLSGDGGDDTLWGQAGRDSLDGGEGTDLLDGGFGRDTCVAGETLRSCEA